VPGFSGLFWDSPLFAATLRAAATSAKPPAVAYKGVTKASLNAATGMTYSYQSAGMLKSAVADLRMPPLKNVDTVLAAGMTEGTSLCCYPSTNQPTPLHLLTHQTRRAAEKEGVAAKVVAAAEERVTREARGRRAAAIEEAKTLRAAAAIRRLQAWGAERVAAMRAERARLAALPTRDD